MYSAYPWRACRCVTFGTLWLVLRMLQFVMSCFVQYVDFGENRVTIDYCKGFCRCQIILRVYADRQTCSWHCTIGAQNDCFCKHIVNNTMQFFFLVPRMIILRHNVFHWGILAKKRSILWVGPHKFMHAQRQHHAVDDAQRPAVADVFCFSKSRQGLSLGWLASCGGPD